MRSIHVRLWLLLIVAGGLTVAESPPVIAHDWGPIFSSWTDVHGNHRTRFLGPVGEHMVSPGDDTQHAVRPFYFSWVDADRTFRQSEALWPVYVRRSHAESVYWRFLLTFFWNWDVENSDSRWRLWSLPFYFQGRDTHGESYVALFPLAGSIHEFFFWDRIDFTLFPLYVKSQLNEIEATSYVWPFYSRTKGPGLERFRVFPFYGYSDKKGVGRKTFVMWPFWNQVRYTLPKSRGTGWILFPLLGHLKLTDQETWWFLPPIFRYTIGEEQNRLFGPWPIIQKGECEVDKFYIFPLYGRKQHAGIDSRFLLWPIGHYEKSEQVTGIKTKFFIVPFVQRFTEMPAEELGGEDQSSSYIKIWPLFSHLSKENGHIQRTAFLDLNPLRGGPIERNYAPFWQMYVRTQVRDRVDTEVLWGLYRSAARGDAYRYRSLFPVFSWSKGEDEGHFSLLKGLLGRRRKGEKRVRKVLYLF
ncbi:MAG: hypothetical protein PF795_05825 [Kiritimatiellae bacterium]|nr:hypothetical protein [Kiritimatiellia bacterium]